MWRAFSIYLFIVKWLAMIVSSSTFLLSSECPAPPPCSCHDSAISCGSRRLTAVPQFGVFNASFNDFTILLDHNSITTIPDNAFRNLSSIKAREITIFLDNNRLHTMGTNAFAGVENVTQLELNNNNFTSIPTAIGSLKRLLFLGMVGNPLTSLDHFVFSSIGNTLVGFGFDVNLFTEWPGAELRLLTRLQNLEVHKIPYSHLDANTFLGLEKNLMSLKMINPRLVKIPQAICQLTRLLELHVSIDYDSNLNVNMSSIFEPCTYPMYSTRVLSLSVKNLHIFPDVFSLFPSLTTLKALNGKFEYIDSSKIPSDSQLESLYLNDNLFERIPSALPKLKFLTYLNLNNNKIKTVEPYDLNSLIKLETLYLNDNPLVYISPDALSHNPEMKYLYLENTQLDHVPRDVSHLSNLIVLYLSGRAIDCTCDMSYLKHWNVSAVSYFVTPCASSTETIKTYIMTSLQSCP